MLTNRLGLQLEDDGGGCQGRTGWRQVANGSDNAYQLSVFISLNMSINPLLPKWGGASGAPPPLFLTNNFFLLSKLCSVLLRIPKQMENEHFAENLITGVPLGHVWSVVEHI